MVSAALCDFLFVLFGHLYVHCCLLLLICTIYTNIPLMNMVHFADHFQQVRIDIERKGLEEGGIERNNKQVAFSHEGHCYRVCLLHCFFCFSAVIVTSLLWLNLISSSHHIRLDCFITVLFTIIGNSSPPLQQTYREGSYRLFFRRFFFSCG